MNDPGKRNMADLLQAFKLGEEEMIKERMDTIIRFKRAMNRILTLSRFAKDSGIEIDI